MLWEEYELRLVELLKQHPVIYQKNSTLVRRRDALIKEAWDDISNDLGKSVEQCKKRWKNIRTCYIRSQRVLREGKHQVTKSKYLDGTLSFLDSEIDINTTKGPSSKSINPEEELRDVYYVTQDMIQSLLEKSSKVSDVVVSDGALKELVDEKLKILMNAKETDSGASPSPDSNNSNLIQTDNCNDTQNAIKLKTIYGLNQKTCEHDDGKTAQVINTPQWITDLNASEADTKQFFSDLSELVSLLPLDKQNEIRLKICSLLTAAEIEILQNEGI